MEIDKSAIIAIGSDHGGWDLKEHIKSFLGEKGHTIKDFGCFSPNSCDYPDIGSAVARSIYNGILTRGILVCGTGIGMSIVANKFPGIRAALCHDLYTARMSREHNDANILVMGGRLIGKGLAEEMVTVWLKTTFLSSPDRHIKRLQKIVTLEKEIGAL